ncbi:mitochondrial carrier domain-containing protein [Globomyces pollinis-pini]|nr:mitochondrial carrier domain-containing protein [Globomyces pollinis-pini]
MLTGSQATDQALAGFLAGTVSTGVLHPLDLIKTRLQVNETSRISISKIVINAAKKDGVLSFYRGISANLAGASLSWGLFFFWYSKMKTSMSNGDNDKLSPIGHLSASATAGFLTTLVTNPIWVVKTRMLTQNRIDAGAYSGLYDGLRKIYRHEGLSGLYRGLVPAIFGVSHGAVQFMVYEELKRFNSEREMFSGTLGSVAMASVSKVCATICTYPYQVVKSRMQVEGRYVQEEYSTVLKTIRTIYTNERVTGFYKGMGVNIVRVLPGTCITFAVYELASYKFQNW